MRIEKTASNTWTLRNSKESITKWFRLLKTIKLIRNSKDEKLLISVQVTNYGSLLKQKAEPEVSHSLIMKISSLVIWVVGLSHLLHSMSRRTTTGHTNPNEAAQKILLQTSLKIQALVTTKYLNNTNPKYCIEINTKF